ncbi:MAG TPA: serine protease [Candidatus Thermoplasmatota archaeon]|nr:serine protease [Candidatus Thermoplasmatota archaeon]
MRAILWLVPLALLAPTTAAIYGGTEAPEGAYPFMAHIFTGEPHEGIECGGVLIAPTLVLTAGHCLVGIVDWVPVAGRLLSGGQRMEDYRVLLGRADLLAEGGETIEVVAGYRPDTYWPIGFSFGALFPADDIAIMELARPSSYAPARVATPDDVGLYPPGTRARVLGWGCTPDVCFPSKLMQVDVPVWSDEACGQALQYRVMFHAETEVCAGAAGIDSCGGDSGGPLFVYGDGAPVVFGIVNYGPFGDCGDAEHPGVYAEVAAYAEFLAEFREHRVRDSPLE